MLIPLSLVNQVIVKLLSVFFLLSLSYGSAGGPTAEAPKGRGPFFLFVFLILFIFFVYFLFFSFIVFLILLVFLICFFLFLLI